MDKTAQERSFLNKLREKTNLTGKMLESVNPEFANMMDNLRKTDASVRELAKESRQGVKWARSFVNRRDYLSAALNFSAFHENCRKIAFDFEELRDSVNLKHYKFLLDQFDDEYKDRLFDYDPEKILERTEKEASAVYSALTKYSGMSDFLANLASNLTSKGATMRAFEKRFSVGFLKQLKTDSNLIADKTEEFLVFMLSTFKKLGTALATRDAQGYIEGASEFIKRFASYHSLYVKYFNTNIKPLKEKHIEMVREQNEAAAREMEEAAERKRNPNGVQPHFPKALPNAPTMDLDNSPTAPVQNTLPTEEEKAQALNALPKEDSVQPTPIAMPQVEEQDDENTDVRPGVIPTPLQIVPKAANFIAKIEKFASINDLDSMSNALYTYAALIEDTNEEQALKLIAIAEGIKSVAPGSAQKKTLESVKKLEIKDPTKLEMPANRPLPIDHGLPEGRVEKKFFDVPFLKTITADKIKITPNAAAHLTGLVIKRLQDLGFDNVINFSQQLEGKILNEVRLAIIRGIVLTSTKTEDVNHPKDRYLDIYSYISLSAIDKRMQGVAKLKIYCRLSAFTGTLSVRTIQKNFTL